MSTILRAPEDVVNNAIARLGYTQRIGSLLEGSQASKLALDLYSQERDRALREGNWQFARHDAVLTLINAAPEEGYSPATPWDGATYPPQPWSYQYEYPADCLRVLSIKQQQIFIPDFAPTAVVFTTYNGQTEDDPPVPVKTLLCNVGPTAIVVYRRQVTNPANWDPGFTEALCANLAKLLSPGLQPSMFQAAAAGGQIETAKAQMEQQG